MFCFWYLGIAEEENSGDILSTSTHQHCLEVIVEFVHAVATLEFEEKKSKDRKIMLAKVLISSLTY